MKKIPIYQPFLNGNESKYVKDCMESNWISSKGKYVSKFEESVENYIGDVSATSCSNGTVALHLALLAINIRPGDEVIVPTFTYIASVNAIKYVGAKPVFVDCDSKTWNVTHDLIESKITKKTKAIMCVHLYGVPVDIDPIIDLAKKNNIKIIEDCAEAFGSLYKNIHVGIKGDISTLSFFGNKTITTGEGGMVFSKDKRLIEKVALLKNQAVSKEIPYWHEIIGYNYRLTNIASAIGLAQLESISKILDLKDKIKVAYKTKLDNLNINFQALPEKSISSNWLVVIKFVDKNILDKVMDELDKAGIETRPAFPLVSDMPPYVDSSDSNYPNAREISSSSLCLPSYPELKEENIKYITDVIKNSLK